MIDWRSLLNILFPIRLTIKFVPSFQKLRFWDTVKSMHPINVSVPDGMSTFFFPKSIAASLVVRWLDWFRMFSGST